MKKYLINSIVACLFIVIQYNYSSKIESFSFKICCNYLTISVLTFYLIYNMLNIFKTIKLIEE